MSLMIPLKISDCGQGGGFVWNKHENVGLHQKWFYRKNSKNWDTLNYYRDCPTNGIVGFYSAILRSKDADRITNRVDTDQTAP